MVVHNPHCYRVLTHAWAPWDTLERLQFILDYQSRYHCEVCLPFCLVRSCGRHRLGRIGDLLLPLCGGHFAQVNFDSADVYTWAVHNASMTGELATDLYELNNTIQALHNEYRGRYPHWYLN
ncbi:uncharacterized protein LOC62_04G006556 [Vanrija pseudolonga]|uniref:Uncharacterized protein n=1 Tax=Vanrija pseudolonga TaxID=143232 RepID=A0AAF0YAB2_9TREE|nr:hypothetical protein LOC62_04G006556 [Vanrija pseudolonga]